MSTTIKRLLSSDFIILFDGGHCVRNQHSYVKRYNFPPLYIVGEMVEFIFSSTNVSTLSTPEGADM